MLGVGGIVVVGVGEICEHKAPKVFWTYGPKKFYELRANHVACVANASGSASPPRSQVQVECLNFCPGSFFFPRVSGEKLFFFDSRRCIFFPGPTPTNWHEFARMDTFHKAIPWRICRNSYRDLKTANLQETRSRFWVMWSDASRWWTIKDRSREDMKRGKLGKPGFLRVEKKNL